jgi:hypothetical protein
VSRSQAAIPSPSSRRDHQQPATSNATPSSSRAHNHRTTGTRHHPRPTTAHPPVQYSAAETTGADQQGRSAEPASRGQRPYRWSPPSQVRGEGREGPACKGYCALSGLRRSRLVTVGGGVAAVGEVSSRVAGAAGSGRSLRPGRRAPGDPTGPPAAAGSSGRLALPRPVTRAAYRTGSRTARARADSGPTGSGPSSGPGMSWAWPHDRKGHA